MCGIAGVLRLGLDPAPAERPLEPVTTAMIDAISHRGPDGRGRYDGSGIVLGHARLSILDLEGGAQPMVDEARRYVLVYNGEIYNHAEVRGSLTRPHTFVTRTDSEAIVHLFEDLGPDAASSFRGMFAYAVWDSSDRVLHLAVDSFGMKPLYYYLDENLFLFCSELRGLMVGLERAGIAPVLDHAALRAFLALGWTPFPATPVASVRKLSPGSIASIAQGTGAWVERFPRQRGVQGVPMSDDEALARLDLLLGESVREQLVADVPVGILLSGGIDSSLVASYAAEERGERIPSFTVGFSGAGRDVASANEAAAGARVAAWLRTDHHEITVDEGRVLAGLDESFRAMDEPIADPAILPLLIVSEFASEHVKVCLCGDGGDELFGGYLRHVAEPWKERFHRFPKPFRNAARAVAGSLRERSGESRTMRRAASLAELVVDPSYVTGPFGADFGIHLAESVPATGQVPRYPTSDPMVTRAFDLEGQMAGQLLPKTDRVAMWASLEVRVPFLSEKLAELSLQLTRRQRVRGLQNKVLLRELARRRLPRDIADRAKHGFRLPVSGWFRTALRERLERQLLDDCVIPPDVISSASISRIVNEHCSSRSDHGIRLWALMALDSWIRLNLSNGRVVRSHESASKTA